MKKTALIAITLLIAPLSSYAAAPPAKAVAILESAFSCTQLASNFEPAQALLASAGWDISQGAKPVTLPFALKVFGLPAQKVVVLRDSGEQLYRAYFPGVSQQSLIKAAKLKLGRDGQEYGRATKLGVLTAGTEDGVSTLSCTIDTEG